MSRIYKVYMNIMKWFTKEEQRRIYQTDLPKFVYELNELRNPFGPNCWNATIKYFHNNHPVEFTSQEVMIMWLMNNTYEDQYKLQATGSILALYTHELIHTAVYVCPGILWHKRGCSGPYEFITEKELRRIYSEATSFEYRIAK